MDNGFRAYFEWYGEQCISAGEEISVITHRELLRVIDMLKVRHESHASILRKLQERSSVSRNEKFLCGFMRLAARIWLMLSIGEFDQCLGVSPSIAWSNHVRLADVVSKEFNIRNNDASIQVKLQQVFNAANLERIAGIRVVWTSKLSEHLMLKDDDTKVHLYHQISFLKCHGKSPSPSPYSQDLIDETISSLRLLLPSVSYRQSSKWFQRQQRKHGLDMEAGLCGRLTAAERRIDKFNYWRDRLVYLKEAFDDAEPRSLKQLWYDNRKKGQWYTFWAAVLVLFMTFVFGLLQSIAGVIQAWASVQSLRRLD